MLEADYKRDIREALYKLGAKTIPIVTGPLTEKGTPDIIGVMNGQCFVIEAKIWPNKPSAIQWTRLMEWQDAGAIALLSFYPRQTAEGTALAIYNMSRLSKDESMEASKSGLRVPETT